MKHKKKTLFLGPFSPPFTGDGVKNDYLREGFETEGIKNIIWFDTIKRQSSSIAFYFKLLRLILGSRQIIFSLNIRGRFTIIPIFWFFSLFSRKRGVLYVIGGTFHKQIENLSTIFRKIFVCMLNSLQGIFVESVALKEGLEQQGVKNVSTIFNPRKDDGTRWQLSNNNKNKAVFISRVTDDKGVTVLMDAIESINKEGIKIILDVYGPLDENYEQYFSERLSYSKGIITYKGILKPDEVQPALQNYHFLALPTFHSGEGLPGILVEAGMTGIPIIITRFNALPEYFKHNESALFVEPCNVESLKNEILRLIDNEDLNNSLTTGILKTIEPFKLENVIIKSLDFLKGKGWRLNSN